MHFFIDKIYPYRWIIMIISIVILFIAIIVEGTFLVLQQEKTTTSEITLEEPEEEIEELSAYLIDIKGAVKKPGVYSLEKGTTINDAITAAGGLKYGGTTKNINLSKKISNEMVLYIYTNSELEKKKDETTCEVCEECVCDTVDIRPCTEDKNSVITSSSAKEDTTQEITTNTSKEENTDNTSSGTKEDTIAIVKDKTDTNNKKVNINEAVKEELMSLNGIGEKTAEKIIAYRNENGKFSKIDDITNVSGIGASVFEKIKENITV